eukprot:Em0001g852a
MNRCKFCVAPVLDSKKRRLLSSQESERNAAALVDLACEAGVARNEATKEYTTGYLCTKCFNSIGNFSALKEKVGRLKGEFVSKLHESLRSCDSAMTSESKGTKRKASTQQSGKAVKIVVTYKGRERRYELSSTRGAIAKSLGRNSKQAFANHSFKSQAVRNHLLARIHRTIRQEMKNILTSRDCTVTLNESNPGIFTSDAWENQFTALQHVAPVLTGILNASIPRNSSRRQCTMASCIGILVKSHGRSTLAHLFTSLILYSGHAAKQVYARLQKLGLCLSINSTLKLIDILGDDHDHLVKDWVTTLTTQTASSNVPLGVLLKNENVLNDMVDILDELHKYVPRTTTMQTIDVCTGGGGTTAVDIHVNTFSHIPLEGDQLTVARIRGSQRVEFNAENGDERLEGFFPVIEDWHTKMCFMEVIWKRLYNSCSGMDAGTLFQLREVINRRNVISDVTKDLTACEEFMELVTTAHVLTAAMHVAGASNLTDLSSKILSKENPTAAATSLVQTLCRQMVTIEFIMDKSTCGSGDRVVEYAMETLSLGLLLLEFKDSIREGDGYRVLRCWKYFLLIFRATQHKNYCIEALNLLMQYYYILPQRYAEQMLWGRFVNSEGGPCRAEYLR